MWLIKVSGSLWTIFSYPNNDNNKDPMGGYHLYSNLPNAHAQKPSILKNHHQKSKHQGLCNPNPIAITSSLTLPAAHSVNFPTPPFVLNMPNLKKTSEQVTAMLMRISTMIIHVNLELRSSAMESLRISARSRKTRQRSLRACTRGLISRYSRTAW